MAVSITPAVKYSPNQGAMMKRREANGLQRAYLLWTIAGVSLVAAAVAGSAVFRLMSGTADTASAIWGIVGIAALLASLVLFVLGWKLRQRYVNTVRSYESRGAYLEDDGSNRTGVPLLGDGQARPNITNPGPGPGLN